MTDKGNSKETTYNKIVTWSAWLGSSYSTETPPIFPWCLPVLFGMYKDAVIDHLHYPRKVRMAPEVSVSGSPVNGK